MALVGSRVELEAEEVLAMGNAGATPGAGSGAREGWASPAGLAEVPPPWSGVGDLPAPALALRKGKGRGLVAGIWPWQSVPFGTGGTLQCTGATGPGILDPEFGPGTGGCG